ncbi:MAG: LbtU family siderophore porin [Desulfuromonadaceae bacterium]|nr:LbtU family siderophore porin [Desulfuromonadaceae bacterium]
MKYAVKTWSLLLTLILGLALPALSFAVETSEESGLPERVKKLEEAMDIADMSRWFERISLSGLIEVEAGYENIDYDDPAANDEDSSDLTLATVELGIDIDFIKHVSGQVLLLWEEDETEPLDVDEAFIRLDGEDVLPLYLQAGKIYVPFGNFETHFISDPNTLELGETRESAAVVGYANDLFDLSLGVFNGDLEEEDQDDHIDSFVASGVFTLPEESVPGLALATGLSWISNIADSDLLTDTIEDAAEDAAVDAFIDNKVDGLAAFLIATLNERWTLIAEYVGALDEFDDADPGLGGLEPKTWNFELGCAVTDALTVATKYEGGDDLGDLLPDEQYGIVASYSLFKYTTLALEYLHGEFENDDERDLATAQLAFEF